MTTVLFDHATFRRLINKQRETRFTTVATAAQPDRGDSSSFFEALAPHDHERHEGPQLAGVENTDETADDDDEPSPTNDDLTNPNRRQAACRNYSAGLQSSGGRQGGTEILPSQRPGSPRDGGVPS